MQPTSPSEHEEKALTLVERATGLTIRSQQDYEAAANVGRELRALYRDIELYWDGTDERPGPVAQAHRAWKTVCGKRKEMLDPIAAATAKLSNAISAYDQEQEERRKEAQRLLDEAARIQREKEIADALAAAKADGATKRELKQIEKQELAAPVSTPVVAAAPKPAGLSVPKPWDARLTNLMLLVKAIAAGKAPITLVHFDESMARRYAQSTKGTVEVPGVEFYQKAQVRYGR